MLIAFAPIRHIANGALLPVSIAIHRQDPDDRPRQVAALGEDRNFIEESGGTYSVITRHLAVYVREIEALREFRSDFAFHNFNISRIRTIFVDDITIDFPTLRWISDEFPFLQMIRFRNVHFEMTTWRNLDDQICLFDNTRRLRIVNFENCVFLEDIGVVRMRGTPRLMANRIPIYFYRYMVMHGVLANIDLATGKSFFFLLF